MTIKDEQAAFYEGKLREIAARHEVDLLARPPHGWRVYRGGVMVDFWPRTGTWRTPTGTKQGTGYRSMLDYLGVKE